MGCKYYFDGKEYDRDSFLATLKSAPPARLNDIIPGLAAPPDAPFKRTEEWLGLGMKRVLDEAAAGGYSRVAWTTGAQQADRYDLSKQISQVIYDPESMQLRAFDLDGELVHSGDYRPEQLPDVIGKDAAERLLASPPSGGGRVVTASEFLNRAGLDRRMSPLRRDDQFVVVDSEGTYLASAPRAEDLSVPDEPAWHVLEGENLKVGGEGMRSFYDRMIPNWLKDYGRRLGVAIEVEPLAAGGPALLPEGFTVKEITEGGARGKFFVMDRVGHWTGIEGDTPDEAVSVFMRLSGAGDIGGGGSADVTANPSFRVTDELRERIRQGQPIGAADPGLVNRLALAGTSTVAGGAAGGYLDEENPTRGAIAGAATGALLGSGWLLPRKGPRVPPSGFRQRAATAWKAGLLTALRTHEVNVASNVGLAVAETAKDAPAALGDALLSGVFHTTRTKGTGRSLPVLGGALLGGAAGATQGETPGERVRNATLGAAAGGAGTLGAVSWRAARDGLRQAREVIAGRAPSTASARFEVQETRFDNAILDNAYRFVFRALGAEDAFFRSVAMERSLREQAEVFVRNQGLRGQQARGAAEETYRMLTASPESVDPSVLQHFGPELDGMRLRAIADAEIATFQDETAIGTAIGKWGDIPVLGTITAPFRKTPGAVATRLVQYSPAGFVISGVQTNRLVRALKEGADPEAAATLQRYASEAFGRAVTGTAMIGLGYVLGRLGMATGAYPTSPSERGQWQQDGTQANSVYLGGQWIEFGRLSPLGNLWGIGASIAEAEREGGTSLGTVAGATTQAALDQTFLPGVDQLVEAVKDPDGRAADRYVQNLAGSVVPAGVASVARGMDTTVRQPDARELPVVGSDRGAIDAVRARIPGLSRQVGAKVGPLGEDVPRQAVNEVLPTRMSEDRRSDPLVRELDRVGVVVSPVKRNRGESTEHHRERQRRTGQAISSVLNAMLFDQYDENEYLRQMDGETARDFMRRGRKVSEYAERYRNAEAHVRSAERYVRAGANRDFRALVRDVGGDSADARRLVAALRKPGRPPTEELVAQRRKKAVQGAITMVRRSYNARMVERKPNRRRSAPAH